ncbi:helix-turn-helix transcriptional regulator [Klebsiella pneumoniae]|uniref:AraC family transcriptional regulator n=1 Tax=Klebsiella pneumoniae TaxID=573 RepID=UPI000E2CBD05|nr:AraC family transcriptional regulator [Klebsiella pneumoniae]MCG5554289.1 helix-turn-helix transcriptional regulator [Klebsiella pneumoniae]MCG5564951.1 helix-turn-helix transcriptional regulator [Klebsiella pneumoniae]MDE5249171.1 helix-turn-helix transcriptional regulator [Klebsiella pneumoniae]SWK81773.1 AraC/XylS family transcriptional regulator [Klebsiella pneumoniae]HDA9782074.1 helix-turn-helix transcriptional regulator [Klebsiella pneumoniae]
MNSQNALSNMSLAVRGDISCNSTLVLKKIRFYNCAIIYLRNAQLLVKTIDGEVINIPPESICYIEKNTVIDVTLNVLGKGMPYDIFHIDNNILSCICKVMEPLLLNPHKVGSMRSRIFNCTADKTDVEIFKIITEANVPHHRLIYNITYLLSKVDDIESLVCSLSVSTDSTFTEKLKLIIESDLSKSWRLVDLANVLHMSEVSIRKKLEKENNNFNNLILDIRMQHAARLITTTEKHINSISDEVGYVSTSYFIRNFKSYFGITPKQFSLKVKRKS